MSHTGFKLDGLSAHQEDRWKNIDRRDVVEALNAGFGVVGRMFGLIVVLVLVVGGGAMFATLNVATCSGSRTVTVDGTVSGTLHELFPDNYQAALDYVEATYRNDLSVVGSTFTAPTSCG